MSVIEKNPIGLTVHERIGRFSECQWDLKSREL